MNKLNRKVQLRLLTFVLSGILLVAFHGKLLRHPGSYTFDKAGDGAKAQFCILYHIQDKGSPMFHFRGMNYPFGENLNYVDAQPIITVLLKLMHNIGLPTEKYAIGILHLLMFLGYPIAALLLLEIFLKYGIRNYLTVIISVLIAFTSPQYPRFTGHSSLAYCFIIPLGWLLYISIPENKRKGLYYVILIFFSICAGLIHMYYIGILSILFLTLIAASKKSIKLKSIEVVLIVLLPVLFLRLFLILSGDNIHDRVYMPYGAFGEDFRSRPEDVFFPSRYSHWVDYINLNWIARSSWEGEAFIGFSFWVIIIVMIWVFFSRRKEKIYRFFSLKSGNIYYLLSVIFIFTITTGTLYIVFNHQQLLRFPEFLRNFRALGRLSWLVYFIITIQSSVYFMKWLKATKNRLVPAIFIVLIVILGALDVVDIHSRLKQATSSEYSLEKPEEIAAKHLATLINPSQYQALMVLPYYYIGSDVIGERELKSNLFYDSYLFALGTGLPLTDMNSTRTSTGQARMQIDLFGNCDNRVCRYYPNHKPFLILTDSLGLKNINELQGRYQKEYYYKERDYIKKAILVAAKDKFLLYRLDYNVLCDSSASL